MRGTTHTHRFSINRPLGMKVGANNGALCAVCIKGGDGGSGVAIIRFRRKEKGFIISFGWGKREKVAVRWLHPRRRVPRGPLMSCFEKPPRGRRLRPRYRAVDRAAIFTRQLKSAAAGEKLV